MCISKSFSVIILIFASLYSQSQTTAPGYYISQEGDTIDVQVRIRKGVMGQTTNDFTNILEIEDSVKGFKKLTPEEIMGYGLTFKGKRYVFAAKPVKDGSRKFLYPVYVGPVSSLYEYSVYTSSGDVTTSSNKVFYTFEKSDGTCLFLRNMLGKKFKSQLKEFYKDVPEVQPLIDERLKYWLDLEKDLKVIMWKINQSAKP